MVDVAHSLLIDAELLHDFLEKALILGDTHGTSGRGHDLLQPLLQIHTWLLEGHPQFAMSGNYTDREKGKEEEEEEVEVVMLNEEEEEEEEEEK